MIFASGVVAFALPSNFTSVTARPSTMFDWIEMLALSGERWGADARSQWAKGLSGTSLSTTGTRPGTSLVLSWSWSWPTGSVRTLAILPDLTPRRAPPTFSIVSSVTFSSPALKLASAETPGMVKLSIRRAARLSLTS